MTENLPVKQALPKIEKYNIDDEALEKIEYLYQVMNSTPAGLEQEVEWRPENLKLRHPITSDNQMPPDAAIGDLYANGEVLWSSEDDGSKNPFKFVLCYAWKSRIRFPEGERQPDCRSEDLEWNVEGTLKCENCPDLPFRNGNPTDCNNTLNMVLLPLSMDGVYIARFSKSSYSAGSNIRKLLRGKLHAWDKVFGLTTTKRSSKNNEWYVYQTTGLNEEVPDECALFAEYISKEMKAQREAYLERLEEQRENVQETIDAMDDIDDDFGEDADFSDSM